MTPLQLALLCVGLGLTLAALVGWVRGRPVRPITEADLYDAFCNAADGSDDQARAREAWAAARERRVAA